MAVALAQVQATCAYSPPPMLSQGQGADTLGRSRVNVGAEVGYGAAGSWWKASNVGDPDINSDPAGALRVRFGLADDVDLGVVGAVGPDTTIVAGPEVKWRFARLVEGPREDAPAFHASWVSGTGLGSSVFRYGADGLQAGTRHFYIAPYTGILVSGGIPLVQMFGGLRFAASQTLDASRTDWTLYPVLPFGVELRPEKAIRLFVEADLAGGYTTQTSNGSAILGYVTGGMSVTFGGSPAVGETRRTGSR
jgi:hypothetical protein